MATFGITYGNKFMSMKLIYKQKSERSLPGVKFPGYFLLSANENHLHWNN